MMKLLRCHIENFGTLHDFDFSFDENLCVVKEDNGFGKSTLAAFIKAMFYGMPVTRKQELDENERKKYEPWQGGVFGGSLDFSCEKGEYRIERSFGSKQKDDKFNLFDIRLGKHSSDFSENIGTEIFGMGAEGFMRSVFVAQAKTETSATADITAKLTRLVENSDDISNYDSAMKALRQQQLTGGVKGAISSAERQITALEIERRECSAAAEEITVLQKSEQMLSLEKAEKSEMLNKLREKIRKASDIAAAKERLDRRKETEVQLKNAERSLQELKDKYKNGLPTEDELLKAERDLAELSSIKAKIGVLEEQCLSSGELQSTEEFFKGNIPSEQDIERCREDLKCAEKAEELARLIPAQDQSHGTAKVKSLKFIALIFLSLGIVPIVLSAVLFAAFSYLWGIVLAVLGLAVMLSGLIMLKKSGRLKRADSESADNSENRNKYLDESSAYRQRAKDFVSGYADGDVREVLETVAAKLKVYKILKKTADEINFQLEAEKRFETLKSQEVESFFKKILGEKTSEPIAVLSAVRRDTADFEVLGKTIEELGKKLGETLEISVDITEDIDVETLVLEEKSVSEALGILADQMASVKARIASAEPKAARLGDVISDIEERTEQCEFYKKQLRAVEIAAEMLTAARDNLSASYMQTMKQNFEKYVLEISGDGIGQYLLDNDFNLRITRVGTTREKEYFSSGVKDMLDICMRLALIDALYEGEKPMLILDDPFVNLDDDRLEYALKLLEIISKNRQILYLTCHSARIPK